MWYQKKALYVALGLGIVHILVTYISPIPISINEFERAAIFIAVAYVIGSVSEKRAEAEESLRETRNYLDNLIQYANAPIIVWDPDMRISRFNGAFETLTEYTADEVIGKKLALLFPQESRGRSLEKIAQTSSNEHWDSVEIPILRKDGDVRVALWNSANIYAQGGETLVATMAQGQDITERKQAEESLRETRDYLDNLIQYANAPIIVWDPDMRITRFNGAFEDLTGYTADEVMGKELAILFPEKSRGRSLEKIDQTSSGEHWESVEIPILQKGGDVRLALWNSANIYAKDGENLVATMAQGQDITERKRAEDALAAEMERLDVTLRSIGDGVIVTNTEGKVTLINKVAQDLTGWSEDEALEKPLNEIFHIT